jgi:carboxyl-terminal processing protease
MQEKNSQFFWLSTIALSIVFVLGFFLGTSQSIFPGARASSALPPEDVNFAELYAAYRLLEEHYQAASSTAPLITPEERIWGAISGLADSYGDPYTTFLPPEDKEFFESSIRGDFEGVGMEIGIRDDVITVVAPLKDTPAYRAGIQSGDMIIAIDDVSTRDMGVEQAVGKIRGEKGTTVVLTLVRNGGDAFDVPVVRDTILLPTLETELRDDGVFVIQLFNFNAIAPQLFRDALREFAESGSDAMIIDLRGNPGGFLEVAVDIASWFLPVGKSIVIEDHNNDDLDKTLRSRGYDVFSDQLKLAILINEGSASASEILAGALASHNKATIIGTTSFGKGSVQQLFDVSNESSIKITVARWLTPDGVSISDGGLQPDIEVELTDEDIENEYDRQLEFAADYVRNR